MIELGFFLFGVLVGGLVVDILHRPPGARLRLW